MNSEVDLTKQCYQIWQKVAKVAKKCYQKWQKVAKVAKKCQKWFYSVRTTQAWPPLTEAGPLGQPKVRWRRLTQGPKGPELVFIKDMFIKSSIQYTHTMNVISSILFLISSKSRDP